MTDDAAKTAAEIAKLEAETADLAKQIELRDVELERDKQDARSKFFNAEVARMVYEKTKRDEEWKSYANERNYVYTFDDRVDARTCENLRDTLARWHRQDPKADWEIVFNSPGGSVIDGNALLDDIHAYSLRGGGSHKITTKIRGYAASMGGILLQAGDVRVAGPLSYLMIHEISAGAGGKVGELEDSMKFYRMLCEQVVDLFVERSGGKCSRDEFITNWERKDWWLPAADALSYGFIDRIG